MLYSIIIPAYNESSRIRPTLDKVLAHAAARNWELEIVVVDDGSRDDTAEIIRGYASTHSQVRLVQNPGNHGKGYSVRNGMLQAKGDIRLFSDADLSSPIGEAEKLFEALAQGADVAIGSRWLRAELQTQRQPLYRQFLGRIFNLLLRAVLGLHFEDTQCGFKAFRREAAVNIFPLQRIERWGFDPEILFLARRLKFKTAEVPVVWAHSEGTRLHPIRDGLRMFGDVMRIWWNQWKGAYRPHPSQLPEKLSQ